MVTNGGYGGTQQALAHGIPLVIAGTTEDKPDVAARVAWAGVGINLKTDAPTPEQVRAAVRTLVRSLAAELAPKGIALQHPETTTLWVARPFQRRRPRLGIKPAIVLDRHRPLHRRSPVRQGHAAIAIVADQAELARDVRRRGRRSPHRRDHRTAQQAHGQAADDRRSTPSNGAICAAGNGCEK